MVKDTKATAGYPGLKFSARLQLLLTSSIYFIFALGIYNNDKRLFENPVTLRLERNLPTLVRYYGLEYLSTVDSL